MRLPDNEIRDTTKLLAEGKPLLGKYRFIPFFVGCLQLLMLNSSLLGDERQKQVIAGELIDRYERFFLGDGSQMTLEEKNKDRILKAYSQFFSAYSITNQMRLDAECIAYSGVPTYRMNAWVSEIKLPTSVEQRFLERIAEDSDVLERLVSRKLPNGKSVQDVLYEVTKKSITSLNENLPNDRKVPVCSGLNQSAQSLYEKSKDNLRLYVKETAGSEWQKNKKTGEETIPKTEAKRKTFSVPTPKNQDQLNDYLRQSFGSFFLAHAISYEIKRDSYCSETKIDTYSVETLVDSIDFPSSWSSAKVKENKKQMLQFYAELFKQFKENVKRLVPQERDTTKSNTLARYESIKSKVMESVKNPTQEKVCSTMASGAQEFFEKSLAYINAGLRFEK